VMREPCPICGKVGCVHQLDLPLPTAIRCIHANSRFVWTSFSSYGARYQRRQLRNFCSDCGELLGSALKHSLATADTPTLSLEQATRAQKLRDEWFRQREIEKETQRAAWQAKYDEYLRSEEWANKRALVIERAGGICEGCGEASAVQVHHLTYNNVGEEFLWQLRAICRECHERFHGVENG
jgi:5-methylcytosine-specific restriction endonuclease McrA